MHPLETYLHDLQEIRSSGEATPETAYYGPLRTLFNEVGKSLKPKVRCIISLKNRGAGLPDGGLFTPDQFQKVGDTKTVDSGFMALREKNCGNDSCTLKIMQEKSLLKENYF